MSLIYTGYSVVLMISELCRPLIQSKLQVLSLAGLAKDDFSNADSKVMKVCVMKVYQGVCITHISACAMIL